MRRPAVFFDRDNTLIACDGYLGDPEQVVLIDGAADAVARARRMGFATVIVSNQSGVGRGMFGEDDVRAVNARLDKLLADANSTAIIDRHEFCPFHPEATVESYRHDSELRKPKPGMIFEAARKLALDLPRSWLIGDVPRDIQAGHAAGCRTILFTPKNLAASGAADMPSNVKPDFTVDNLKDAMDIIERESSKPENDATPETPTANTPAPQLDIKRLEALVEQIAVELRRTRHQPPDDFSVTKLLAGIVQVLALAALFVAYLHANDPAKVQIIVTLAIMLQTLTIALLIMGRQK